MVSPVQAAVAATCRLPDSEEEAADATERARAAEQAQAEIERVRAEGLRCSAELRRLREEQDRGASAPADSEEARLAVYGARQREQAAQLEGELSALRQQAEACTRCAATLGLGGRC